MLQHLLALFLEGCVLLLAHLWVSQQPLLYKMTGLERSLEHEALMMLEDTSSFHTPLLPVALLGIAIGPYHLALLVIAAILELALICEIPRDCQFPLAVLAIAFPSALIAGVLSL